MGSSFLPPELSSSHDPLCSALLVHLLQRLVYPNMLGPWVTRRWVLGRPENTTVALYQRVEIIIIIIIVIIIIIMLFTMHNYKAEKKTFRVLDCQRDYRVNYK